MNLLHAATRPLTAREFELMVRQGILHEDERVELIEGNIVQMPPIGPGHSYSVSRGTNELVAAFGATHFVRVQCPLNLLTHSEPQPDFALVPKEALEPHQHPTTADLVIEVADTSLQYDRSEKASVYAAAGIADYWIANVSERRLEVRRDPGPDPAAPAGHSYRSLKVYLPGDSVAPLFRPETALPVTIFVGPD